MPMNGMCRRDRAQHAGVLDLQRVGFGVGVALGDKLALDDVVFHKAVDHDDAAAPVGDDLAGLQFLRCSGLHQDNAVHRDGRIHAAADD